MNQQKAIYFKVLGIEPTNDKALIKKAYRKKAFYWHPDRNESEEASKYFIELTEAYEALVFNKFKKEVPSQSVSGEDLFASRMKHARARYYEAKMKEAIVEKRYFEKLIGGKAGKVYFWFSVLGLLFSFFWLLDFYLLTEVTLPEIIPAYEHHGRYFHFSVQGYTYLFKIQDVISLTQNNSIVATFTPVFGDLKMIQINDVYTGVTRVYPVFSFSFFTPFIQLLCATPFFIFLFKKPLPWFTLGYYFSIYFIFPLLILVLFLKIVI